MTAPEHGDGRTEGGESTREYSSGTDGYSQADESGVTGEPWWKRAGYSSLREFIDEQDRLRAIYEIRPAGAPVPVASMPGVEIPDTAPKAIENRVRQVNVKLRPSEGDDLDRAARLYGLAPSTLARALVNRGVRAILEESGLDSG